MSETEQHPFDIATEAVRDVNDRLADTDGAICEMQFDGAVGYHNYIADGVADPEYLWRTALLQALDETIFEMMHVDDSTASGARAQVERQLEGSLDPFTAEAVAETFEDRLESLIEVQEGDS